jgi:hypothetical protein
VSESEKSGFSEALTVGQQLDLNLPTAAPFGMPTSRHELNRSPGSSTMLRARGSMAPSWHIIARSNPMPSW